MKIRIYLAVIAATFALQSCNDFLDVHPKGYTIPEKFEDYEKLMNYVSLYRSLDIYPSFFTDDILLLDKKQTTVSWFEYEGKSDEKRNLYSFQPGQIFTPGNNDGIWEDSYSNIFTYNAVINNVLSAPDASDTEKKRLRAEALVGRAFEYLNLVNVYGKHYDAATAATDFGVPLVLSEDVSKSYKRNTVGEVYDRISKDLNEATPNLSEEVSHSFRPNKSIGYAFLSRMYLYMGKYSEALTNANEALKVSNELNDFKLYTTKHSTFGRIILADNKDVEFPDEHKNIENIYTRMLNGTSSLFKSVAVSEDLLNAFQENLAPDGKDMRFELLYVTDEANFKTDANAAPEKFIGYSSFAPYLEQNVGFTTPEIYLIAAECEARVGSIDNALGHLNTLRDSRIMGNVHYVNEPAMTKQQVLKLVIDERRREFAFNGIYRLVDLKRMNREAGFAKTITHSVAGQTWELPANDPRYIMPVPLNVLDYNADMPQYER